MLLSDCMRSSSAASRRKPCCLPQRLRPCCSGRCLLPVRSPCAKWTDGKRWQKSQPFNALTLLPEAITSLRWRCRYTNFYQLRDTALPWESRFSQTGNRSSMTLGSDSLIRYVIRDVLPSEFHAAACVWSLSSSTGLTTHLLKCHLWFWLAKSMTSETLKRTLRGHAR